MATKNLGNVRALIKSSTPPTNKDLIWQDTSVEPNVKKIWNTVSLVWEPISTGGGGGVTNLSYTASATNGVVTSDTGADATIPAGSTTNASLILPADKQKLDNQSGINTGDQTAATLPGTAPIGFTGTNQHDINTQFAAAIDLREQIFFDDIGVAAKVTRPYNFTVSAKTESGGIGTITTSTDAAYPVPGATVTANDYLKVTASAVNTRVYLTLTRV